MSPSKTFMAFVPWLSKRPTMVSHSCFNMFSASLTIMLYTQSWAKMVNHHHWVEESFIFPELERATGQPGLMDHPKTQHELFHDGRHALGVPCH